MAEDSRELEIARLAIQRLEQTDPTLLAEAEAALQQAETNVAIARAAAEGDPAAADAAEADLRVAEANYTTLLRGGATPAIRASIHSNRLNVAAANAAAVRNRVSTNDGMVLSAVNEARIARAYDLLTLPGPLSEQQSVSLVQALSASPMNEEDARIIVNSDGYREIEERLRAIPDATREAAREAAAEDERLAAIEHSPTASANEVADAAERRVLRLQRGEDTAAGQARVLRSASAYYVSIYGQIRDADTRSRISGLAAGDNIHDDGRAAILRAIEIYRGGPENSRRLAALAVLNGETGTEQARTDAAAIRYASLLTARVALDTLADRAEEIARGQGLEARTRALTTILRAEHPELGDLPDASIRDIVRNSINAFDQNRARGNAVNSAALSNQVAEYTIRQAIQREANSMRIMSADSVQRDEGDERDARYIDGYSFIELELQDVAGILNRNDGRLARSFGGADGRMDSVEMLNALERAGIVTAWQGENRANWVSGRMDQFNRWNDTNMNRLDVNHDNQLSAQEIRDALRLADFIQQNPALIAQLRATLPTAGSISSNYDTNQNGSIDSVEAARVLMNRGITDPQSINTGAELRAALGMPPQAAAPRERQ